jgi:hypothetical protein
MYHNSESKATGPNALFSLQLLSGRLDTRIETIVQVPAPAYPWQICMLRPQSFVNDSQDKRQHFVRSQADLTKTSVSRHMSLNKVYRPPQHYGKPPPPPKVPPTLLQLPCLQAIKLSSCFPSDLLPHSWLSRSQ